MKDHVHDSVTFNELLELLDHWSKRSWIRVDIFNLLFEPGLQDEVIAGQPTTNSMRDVNRHCKVKSVGAWTKCNVRTSCWSIKTVQMDGLI